MTAKSKIKGNAGERELCKLLSEIFLGSFVRVPNSGANVGGKNVHRRASLSTTQDRAFRGDIIPPRSSPEIDYRIKIIQIVPLSSIVTTRLMSYA